MQAAGLLFGIGICFGVPIGFGKKTSGGSDRLPAAAVLHRDGDKPAHLVYPQLYKSFPLERYGGDVQFVWKEGIFTVQVMLPTG